MEVTLIVILAILSLVAYGLAAFNVSVQRLNMAVLAQGLAVAVAFIALGVLL